MFAAVVAVVILLREVLLPFVAGMVLATRRNDETGKRAEIGDEIHPTVRPSTARRRDQVFYAQRHPLLYQPDRAPCRCIPSCVVNVLSAVLGIHLC